jgi:hypothetical protein
MITVQGHIVSIPFLICLIFLLFYFFIFTVFVLTFVFVLYFVLQIDRRFYDLQANMEDCISRISILMMYDVRSCLIFIVLDLI